MLYVTWLLLQGSWAQAVINLDVAAPVTGASGAIFYASGVFFACSALLLLLRDLWRTVRGRPGDAELSMVHESEEMKQIEALHLEHSLDRTNDRRGTP